MKIGILIPHLFAQDVIIDKVVFSPIHLALELIKELKKLSISSQINEPIHITLFTPGTITSKADTNITVDLNSLGKELELNDCTLQELIVQNPLAFVSIARQIHAELTAKAFQAANSGKIDILHVYMCEDETPLYFANFINKPVVYTHHDPYNFYRKYRVRFPKLTNLNYVSISKSQQKSAPPEMNFVANIYHGIDPTTYEFNSQPDDYFAFLGRIVRNKGCHNAIKACKKTGDTLHIAGKYYVDSAAPEESYWNKHIKPNIDGHQIKYVGFLQPPSETAHFLKNAKAVLLPIEWEEPFGMVAIEAMACGTPVIAYRRGALPEIIEDGVNGFLVNDLASLVNSINNVKSIDRENCRKSVEDRFTSTLMAQNYFKVYKELLNSRQ